MTQNPDVAIFGLNYLPEPTGIAPYTTALAVGLVGRGYSVGARVAQPHYPEWTVRAGYGQWTRIDSIDGVEIRRHKIYVPRAPTAIRRLLSELSFGLRLACSRWGRPGVVVVVSPTLFSAALVVLRLSMTPKRPPIILWVQDVYTLGLTETEQGGAIALQITRWVESKTLGAADRVVVIHQGFKDFLTRELGVEEPKVMTSRNWTHLAPSAPIDSADARRKLGWPADVTLAVHTGNMGVKQGLENVIDAGRLAQQSNANVHFMLIGEGSERRRLEEYARGIATVSILGPLDDHDFRHALAGADVLIVNEKPGVAGMALPSKLTSYFDAGRPIVAATDPAGLTASEVAAADAGIIVPAGNPHALFEAVQKLAGDTERKIRLGLNGRCYRESELDQGAAIDRWASVIQELNHVAGSHDSEHQGPFKRLS